MKRQMMKAVLYTSLKGYMFLCRRTNRCDLTFFSVKQRQKTSLLWYQYIVDKPQMDRARESDKIYWNWVQNKIVSTVVKSILCKQSEDTSSHSFWAHYYGSHGWRKVLSLMMSHLISKSSDAARKEIMIYYPYLLCN